MSVSYSYTKAPVFIDTLVSEIQESTISGTLDSILFKEPNYLDILFTSQISNDDIAILDQLVTTHSGTPIFDDANITAISDGKGGIILKKLPLSLLLDTSDPASSGIVNLATEYNETGYLSSFPKYYIKQDERVVVGEFEQYVINEVGYIEVAGMIEFKEGGMLIIKGVD